MSSFQKLAFWPTGYFRASTSWLLRHRREIAARIDVITAEVTRIGLVKALYGAVKVGDKWVMSENRLGFSVSKGSTLARLCQAYIANGGNPLDISSFMYPDGSETLKLNAKGEPITQDHYPHGGVVAPMSAQSNDPASQPDATGYEAHRGGWLRSDRYYPGRLGGRVDRGTFDSDTIVRTMHQVRSWANQDIRERLQDVEWRIIKQADLREQLLKERDEVLVMAFGGALTEIDSEDYDSERFPSGVRVQNLVGEMQNLIFSPDSNSLSFKAHPQVGFLHFTFPDVPSENRDPLGG